MSGQAHSEKPSWLGEKLHCLGCQNDFSITREIVTQIGYDGRAIVVRCSNKEVGCKRRYMVFKHLIIPLEPSR